LKIRAITSLTSLYKNTITYGFSQGLFVLLQTALVFYLIFSLQTEEFGAYGLARVAPLLLIPLLTMNLPGSIIRFYYEWEKNDEARSALFTIFFTQLLILILVLPFLFMGIAEIIFTYLFQNITFYPILYYTLIAEIIAIPHQYLLKLLRVQEKTITFLFILNGKILFSIIPIVYFVSLEPSAISAVSGYLVGQFIFVFISIFYLLKNCEIKFNLSILKIIFRYTTPTVPETSLNSVISMLDRIILDKFFDLKIIGIYIFSRSIAQFLIPISGIFQTGFIPYYFKIIKDRDFQKVLSSTFNFYNLFLTLCCSFIILFAKELIFIIDKEEYFNSNIIIILLSIYFILETFLIVHYFLIHTTNKTEFLLIGYIIKSLFFFVPIYLFDIYIREISLEIFCSILIFSNVVYILYIDIIKRSIKNIDYNFYKKFIYTFGIILTSVFLSYLSLGLIAFTCKIFFVSIQLFFLYKYIKPYILNYFNQK